MEELLEIAKNSFPPNEGSKKVEGLKSEVEVLWDKWGIPHIYANSIEDAFFCQGYIHAQHRLWQMESFRRLMSGKLSEISGESALESDKHYRTVGFYRLAKKCAQRIVNKKDSKVYSYLNFYINGVNEYVKRAVKNPPIEFAILGIKPSEWTLEDCLKIVSMIEWGLSNWNYPLEVLREYLINKHGKELTNKIIPIIEGTNVNGIKGSNSWAVSPKKSKSGAVILANDPHLPLTLPCLWFLIHLNCPQMNIMGASLPGVPIIVIGHNENIAWGVTNVTADTTDLFKLEINPKNPHQYRYNGKWIDFEVISENIKVKDKDEPVKLEILKSKFGPVIHYFENNNKIYKIPLKNKFAFRWSSLDAHLEENIYGFFEINTAKNWSDFRKALSYLTINPQNFIFGDIEGNIGHQHGGKIPVRNYGNGSIITPGTDEKYNWKGLSDFEKLFSRFNPDTNFVYTANFNDDIAPNGLLIAIDRQIPYRQRRLKKLLESKNKFDLNDFKEIQLDRYTEEAAEVLPLMLEILKKEKNSKKLDDIITILEDWDFYLTKKSIAGAIYKVWHLKTLKYILNPYIEENVLKPFLGSRPFKIKRLFKLYEKNKKELSSVLLKTLNSTIEFLSKQISSDQKRWNWGNLHKFTFAHPFSAANEDAKILNAGPFKVGGDANTLNNGNYDPLEGFKQITGPSYRQIYDLSDWDKSIGIIPGGQSGLPFHKHYKDLVRLWVKGKFIPFLFSHKKIMQNLESTFKIVPK